MVVISIIAVKPAAALERVTLQLKWTHAFQFAGYYAAKEKGFYNEAGLDVVIEQAFPETDVVQQVIAGEAQYGVGSSGLLLDRYEGKPVVVLAVIFQHTPYRIFTSYKIRNISELKGKRIMMENHAQELIAFLQREVGGLEGLKMLPHTFNEKALVYGEADAVSGYITSEPYHYSEERFPYKSFNPRTAGIDFYGDNLFTSERELRDNPGRVKAFREATLKGWRYASEHQDEMIEIIYRRYSQKHSYDYLRFEAGRTVPLLESGLVETGYINPERWEHIAGVYRSLGLISDDFKIDSFIYNPRKQDLIRHYRVHGIIILILLIIACIAFYIYRVNRRLAGIISENEKITEALIISEEQHRQLADHASDVIWTMSDNGRFTYVSPSVERVTGYTPEEIMKRPMHEALAPGSASIALDLYAESLERARRKEHNVEARVDIEVLCKDGSTAWTEVIAVIMFNESGEFIGILGIARDISEKRVAEEKVKNLLKEKEFLLKEVHHRIKNNMNTIRALLYLHADSLTDTISVEALRDAERRIESMMVLYDKLYRSENFREMSGREYLTILIDAIIGNFPNSGRIIVVKNIEEFMIEADVLFHLGILINEILTNSMKHAFKEDEHGRINVSLKAMGEHAELMIGDNGAGMPEEVTLENPEGFGMQLISILTRQIGGTIKIDKGEGTRFILDFNIKNKGESEHEICREVEI